MTRPPVLLATSLLLALGLSACGDTSDPEPDAASEAADAGAACEDGDGTTITVEIGDFLFDPTPVEVERCDSVVWTNVHDQAHTSTGSGGQAWNTGNLAPGASSDPVRFEETGEQAYLCALHPFMEGVVAVS